MSLLNIFTTLRKIEDRINHKCRIRVTINDTAFEIAVLIKNSKTGQFHTFIEVFRAPNESILIDTFVDWVNSEIRQIYEGMDNATKG